MLPDIPSPNQTQGANPPDLLPEVDPNAQPVKPPKDKRRIKKAIFIILFLSLLGVAGFLAWQKTNSKKAPSPQASSTQNNEAKLQSGSIYFQLGKKIIAYTPKTKGKAVLTDKLPMSATVMGFHASGDNWRAYYTVHEDSTFKIFYIENNESAQEIYSSEKFVIAAANAKTKTVAYTEVFAPDPAASASEQVSRHYLITNGETVKLQESADPTGDDKPKSDFASYHYAVGDISPDGTKILYDYISKFYSEGGVAGALELDIATKKTKLIRDTGGVRYTSTGNYLAEESNMGGLGFSDVPLQLTLSSPEKADGEFKQKLQIAGEPNWATLVYQNNDAGFFAVEAKGINYGETGDTTFGGFYRVGFTPAEYEKVEVAGLPSATHAVYQIGTLPLEDPEANCFGVTLNTRGAGSNNNNEAVYKLGAVCIAQGGSLSYEEVESQAYKTSDAYIWAQVL